MTQSTSPAGTPPRPSSGSSTRAAWAAGGAMFAGILLLVDGVLDVLKGIVGIAKDDVYARVGDYTFKFDVAAWGWIMLVLGIVLVVVGAGILKDAEWARAMGLALAGISIIFNFMWLPYTPVWALISIAIALFVIWALCVHDPHPTGPSNGRGTR
ncbi:hypothetical protein [Streptomyces sp. NPDC051211]|uniref:DUF7144 family membrane protein n=1 Tax=Streptomyces sp. NPDC051211 TaxID=3154643 RepID=UPI00344DB315